MRKEKLQETVLNALTYCRLQGDVYALEAEIAEKTAAPTVAVQEEKKGLKKLWNSLTAEFKKEMKREETRDLTAEKAVATDAFALFKANSSKKVIDLAESPEKLKKILDKKLFKRDRYGLKRMQFALAAVISDGREYLRPTESLEVASEILFDDPKAWGELYACYGVNCQKLVKRVKPQQGAEIETGVLVGVGVFSLLALSPLGLGLTGLAAASRACREYTAKKTAQAVTPSEQAAFFAMKLTLLEMGRKVMDDGAFKAEVDAFLTRLGAFRADAEYGWLVEKVDAPACIEKIETCNLCVERLAELLGV